MNFNARIAGILSPAPQNPYSELRDNTRRAEREKARHETRIITSLLDPTIDHNLSLSRNPLNNATWLIQLLLGTFEELVKPKTTGGFFGQEWHKRQVLRSIRRHPALAHRGRVYFKTYDREKGEAQIVWARDPSVCFDLKRGFIFNPLDNNKRIQTPNEYGVLVDLDWGQDLCKKLRTSVQRRDPKMYKKFGLTNG